jgi:peptidyl-prolyl cis-trans isomerase C
VLLIGCEREGPPLLRVEGKLPPGIVAEVGREPIAGTTVARIARAQGVSTEVARDRAISDALLSAAARKTARPAELAVAERSALARGLLEQIRARAEAAGPPSEAEIEAVMRERWPELDRPITVRTTHALVRVSQASDEEKAKALAEKLALTLRSAASPKEFVDRAKAFAAAPFEIIAESLDPVTSDGRAFDPYKGPNGTVTGSYVEDYARAAHAISTPGEQSPVTKTRFGFHVIRLDERLPEQRVPLEVRRPAVTSEVVRRRAKRHTDELLERLKGGGTGRTIETVRAAEELTSRVPVAP